MIGAQGSLFQTIQGIREEGRERKSEGEEGEKVAQGEREREGKKIEE